MMVNMRRNIAIARSSSAVAAALRLFMLLVFTALALPWF
jgi:hypothetical protein